MADEQMRPAAGGAALLIIDMINELDFSGGEALKGAAEATVDPILRLRAEADEAGVPVIYVNDNHGEWHADRTRLVEHILDEGCRGRDLGRRLEPREDDYFVIKPQFSGFYSTNLPVLLPKLTVSRLVLTGVAADICVLFTAADAHMRDYDLWVPSDAVASSDGQRTHWALEIMQNSMGADIRPTGERTLADWVQDA